MKKTILALAFLLTALISVAQDSTLNAPGGLRADGKIYVVGAVVFTILAGLLFYIIRVDRKISRLEKEQSL